MSRHGTRIGLVLLTTLAAGLLACKPKTVEITGDVFIVTKGGQNVKLGLVTVSAVPKDAADDHLRKRTREATEKGLALLEAAKATALAQQAASKRYRYISMHYSSNSHKWMADLEDAKRALDSATRDAKDAEDAFKRVVSVAFLYDGMPAGIASAKTDAEGKFSLIIPYGAKVVLAASGNRQVMNDAEKYHWAVPVDTTLKTQRVLLSNDNMGETTSSLGR